MPFDSALASPDAAPEALDAAFGHLPAEELVAALCRSHVGRIALVSSFGADSAVLLAMVAAAERAMPVLFLDTGQLFRETLAHRDALVARLGLTDVRTIAPDASEVAAADPDGALWYVDSEACCGLRKVAPLGRALAGFDVVLNGRRRHQSPTRAGLRRFEADGPRVKVNPLADWTPGQVAARLRSLDLPAHPLVAQGFPSIGCMPCTSRVMPGEDLRAGRWRGREKVECGIHRPASTRTPAVEPGSAP
ncbi:phosphoadenylyl-sulfate reductase [Roseomonas sp. CCTCC AB2023176]|uniref:phosphoadenylyl-sulfate reductase n=1 Tax=Roseomonas sp. CCTCC AB2023176 TaxID=3342640 RepID=UPI0035D755CB